MSSLLPGPGNKTEWKPWRFGHQGPKAPSAGGNFNQRVGMLTSDVALVKDAKYKEIVTMFASDQEYFLDQFAHAWYKLTTRDMGPRSRCSNQDAPPAQPWQHPLPDSPNSHFDVEKVSRSKNILI